MIPDILSNYVKNKTRVSQGSFNLCTSKTKCETSPRFFQTIYFKNETQEVLEVFSNYFKNKIHTGHPRFFQILQKHDKRFSKCIQITSKTKRKGFPKFFQIISKTRSTWDPRNPFQLLQKQNTRDPRDFSKLLQEQNKEFPWFFQTTSKIKCKGYHRFFELL